MTPERAVRQRRGLRRFTGALAAVATGAALMTGGPAAAHTDLPPGRRLVTHTVKPGDTATGLAVRYHAWTAELIANNHLGRQGRMRVGQRLRIPVVIAAARRDAAGKKAHQKANPEKQANPARKKSRRKAQKNSWQHADPSRRTVRRIIVRTSRRVGVDPQLALAVSWQEAGWQMHHVSSAHAIGAMQVLPTTGAWMSLYAGRRLNLYRTRDNILAGVLLLKVLDDHTRTRRQQIAAYYQGLGAVRRHGLYGETKRYVRNVALIKRRLEQGRPPA